MKTLAIFRVKGVYFMNFQPSKSSRESLTLRNMNGLIFGQVNINSITNRFELRFYLVSNNIDVLLIFETKIDNTFPMCQFCVPGYSVPLILDSTGNGGCFMLYYGTYTL